MQHQPSKADEIARKFVWARKSGRHLTVYPGDVPTELAAAYAVQDAAIARFGDRVSGWKVGRIPSPKSEELGVDRLVGPIFARSIQHVKGDEIPTAQVFAEGFGAVEAEFLFRLGMAPPTGKQRFTLDEAASYVDAVHVGIEIASSPFLGINALGPLVTISDFGNNNGLLVGARVPNWRRAGVDDWLVSLSVNGQVAGTGRASAFADGPLGSVRFLLENLAERGIPAEEGILISTGAVTGVHEVGAGARICTRFGEDFAIECAINHISVA